MRDIFNYFAGFVKIALYWGIVAPFEWGRAMKDCRECKFARLSNGAWFCHRTDPVRLTSWQRGNQQACTLAGILFERKEK